MSRITSLPVILQSADKQLTVASEFECGKTGLLLSLFGHYVDGRLFVTTTSSIHLIPSYWPCKQQKNNRVRSNVSW